MDNNQDCWNMNRRVALILLMIRFFLPVFLIQASFEASAQETNKNSDRVYGFDPLLYNGKVYYYYPAPGIGGTQYLLNEFDSKGAVRVRGITYTDLLLNYDVYNQQLILRFKNSVGSISLIIISEAWLESFDLGGSRYLLIPVVDTTKRIYQVLGDGFYKVLYYRSRELFQDNFKNGGMHYFSGLNRSMFVAENEKIFNFKNNRGFIRTFNPAIQNQIKKYIHDNKVNVKKADDHTMTNLINYCSSLNKT